MNNYQLEKFTPGTYRLTDCKYPGMPIVVPADHLQELSVLFFSAAVELRRETEPAPAAEIPASVHDRKRLMQACWMAVICTVAVWVHEFTGVEYARNAALLGLWLFNTWIAASLLVAPGKLFIHKRDPWSQTLALGSYLMVAVAGWWWTAGVFFGVRLVNLIRYDRWRNARMAAAAARETPEIHGPGANR